MLNIAKTEWLKIKKYPAFWLVISITALSYPGINYILYKGFQDVTKSKEAAGKVASALLGQPFSLPEIWHTAAFASSIFVFIPAIVIIMLITNEYTYKTSRQNIIDGWSRFEFMKAKLLDVVIITAIVTILYTITAISIGLANITDENAHKWQLSYYIGLFALQTFSQLSLAFLVGLMVRKAFIALSIFVFYYLILEPVGVQFLKRYPSETSFFYDIGRFLPLEISDRTIPPPTFIGRFNQKAHQLSLDAVNTHVLYTFILIALTWFLCFRINNRRDL